MTVELEAWIELNQAGRLLDRPRLEALPEPERAPQNLSDQLRDALTASVERSTSRADGRSTAVGRDEGTLGLLLDVVLEEACGLKNGWRKATQITASDGETLLDGTVLKPRRALASNGHTALAVFV